MGGRVRNNELAVDPELVAAAGMSGWTKPLVPAIIIA
jgi:hypothetical protein